MEPTSQNDTSNSAVAEHARRSIEEARAGATELAARSSEALRHNAERAREALYRTADQTAQYMQAQPLKSLLMAAAVGAALALLAGAAGRRRRHS